MSLAIAFGTARSALSATGVESAVVSRNIANQSTPGATRKTAMLSSVPGAGVQVVAIRRASDMALFRGMLGASSAASSQAAFLAGLTTIEQTIGDPENGQSPAARIGKLGDALQQLDAKPDDLVLAAQVVSAAKDVARALNDATATVQGAREQADADMALSVGTINDLLARFATANTAVVKGTAIGADVTDALDTRDQILTALSQEIGISTVTRAGNDVAVYTDSGVTLFEKTARSVTFQPSLTMVAGLAGNAVIIDGVPVTGASATMPIESGRLDGLSRLRDGAATTYQTQLDEIARGLIATFAETDQNATPTKPARPGLFTWPGAPALPAAGAATVGLAASIIVNPAADPAQGGVLTRIRDGGIGTPADPDYVYNSSGAAGFSDRISALVAGLSAAQAFDPASGLNPGAGLTAFANSSTSWFEALRQDADTKSDYQATLQQRAATALSNATGVNLDDELAQMLELERAYGASSKLIAAVDGMLQSLLAAVRP